MNSRIKLFFASGLCAAAACGGLAYAQMEGPTPPDGPMQGLMRAHGRMADRFLAQFDLNRDGKVAHDELNRADGARFAAAAHGAGALSQDQFAAMYAQPLQQHTAQMFRRLDWNGDGKLSLDEYAEPLRVRFETMDSEGSGAESCAANPLQHASNRAGGRSGRGGFGKARFCADNDLNRDGKVTRGEFDTATARRFASLTAGAKVMSEAQFAADALAHYREASARLFKRLDVNKDGKLSLAEFAAPDQKLFARLDKNHDGVVTADELSARGKRVPRRG